MIVFTQARHQAALLLVCLGLLLGCSGQSAPQLDFPSINGSVIAPAQYRGQVLLVNFWATSCSTCVKEMPKLVETHQKYSQQGLRTIAVAMQYDDPAYVRNFAQSRQLPFDVAFDAQGTVAKAFDQVSVTPTTYLINRQGQIVRMYVGEPNFEQLHAEIERAL
jgi:peroxiredoxin